MHRGALFAAFVLTCIAALAAPLAAAPRSRSCLAPTGGDDTARLQAELERCSGGGPRCAVDLCAGVFQTGILRVADFRGTLRGAGAHATILRALPELRVNPRADGFFRDDPFEPGADPWPYLLQLVDGRATLRDFGVLIPAPASGSRPTSGWSLFDGGDPIFELRGAILLTGRSRVDFEVSRVRVEAERDELSPVETTVFHGVEFSGLLFDPGAPEPFPVLPLRGQLRLTDSELVGVPNGSPLSELAHASVLVARNRYRSTIAVDVIDVDRSQLAIRKNRWHVSYRGVQVLQNLDGGPSEASGILVDDNVGTLAPAQAGFGDFVFFQDPIDAATVPGGSVLWATRNRFAQAEGAGAAGSGITASGSAALKLVDNRLSGQVAVGLAVDVARGCLVARNSLGGLDTGAGPDLSFGPGTKGCVAIVEAGDAVQDHGVGNRVIRR